MGELGKERSKIGELGGPWQSWAEVDYYTFDTASSPLVNLVAVAEADQWAWRGSRWRAQHGPPLPIR